VRRFLCCALLVVPLLSRAGGVLDSSVSYEAGVYSLSIEALIDAPAKMVFRLITDYDHLHDINPAIRESRILRTYSPEKYRIRTVTRVCVLFYCRDVTQSQDMVQLPGYTIEAEILPQDSDFRRGRGQWRLTAEGDSTVMHFRAELVPDFFMPPLIGPWLIRREMVDQIREIVMIIEARYRRKETS
jgi:ribosome-associated toxin RatA of RatAB toxin-antitoxin module